MSVSLWVGVTCVIVGAALVAAFAAGHARRPRRPVVVTVERVPEGLAAHGITHEQVERAKWN